MMPPAFGAYDEAAKTFTVTEDSQYARWLRGEPVVPVEHKIETARQRIAFLSTLTFE